MTVFEALSVVAADLARNVCVPAEYVRLYDQWPVASVRTDASGP